MKTLLLIMAALFMPFVALADEPVDIDPEFATEFEKEMLLPMPGRTFRDNFDFNLKRGLEFKHEFMVQKFPFSLSLYGPMDKKKPGIVMKIKGNYGRHPIKLKVYGNIKKQGFLFNIRF